jgi:hypothetical protein
MRMGIVGNTMKIRDIILADVNAINAMIAAMMMMMTIMIMTIVMIGMKMIIVVLFNLSINLNFLFKYVKRFVSAISVPRAYRAVIECLSMTSVIILILLAAAQAHAGDIEPRAYVNTPVGVNFLLVGYAYSDGGLSISGALPIEDAELKLNTGVVAFARSLDVWGKSGKFDIIVPYSELSGNALVDGQPRERQVSGFHDPRMRFSVNFYGSPALSLEEFANYRQDLLVGASVQISAPVGEYDPDKLVNIGANRWFFKPDIGISKAWGAFTLEVSTGMFFFTNNDDFFGGKRLKQDPLYTAQAHLTYNIRPGIWVALSQTYDYGGRTEVDGVEGDDIDDNSRLGATLALPVNRNNSIKLYASTGIRTSIGTDFDLLGIVWQYRWGGGL